MTSEPHEPLVLEDILATPCSCGCDVPDHKPRFPHARCHMESKLRVSFEDGVCTLRCSTCDRIVVRLYTAPPSGPIGPEPVWVRLQHGVVWIEDGPILEICSRGVDPAHGS